MCTLLPSLPGGGCGPRAFPEPPFEPGGHKQAEHRATSEKPHMAELQPCFQVLPGLTDPKGGPCLDLLVTQVWGQYQTPELTLLS